MLNNHKDNNHEESSYGLINELDFKNIKAKADGLMPGYTAKYGCNMFMVKRCPVEMSTTVEVKCYKNEITSIIMECISNPLLRALLADKAPIIHCVQSKNPKSAKIASQYIPNFLSFRHYIEKLEKNLEISSFNADMLLFTTSISGVEKVLAAAMFTGDFDINVDNIGVVPTDPSKPDMKSLAKVDGGYAGNYFFSSGYRVLNFLYYLTNTYCSTVINEKKRMMFNVNLDEMISAVEDIIKISTTDVQYLITQGFNNVKQLGINPKGLTFDAHINHKLNKIGKNPVIANLKNPNLTAEVIQPDVESAWNYVEEFYQNNFKKQHAAFTEFLELLKVINALPCNISNWRNNKWLYTASHLTIFKNYYKIEHEICSAKSDDSSSDQNKYELIASNLINWAFYKNKKIDGRNPIVFANRHYISLDQEEISELIFTDKYLLKNDNVTLVYLLKSFGNYVDHKSLNVSKTKYDYYLSAVFDLNFLEMLLERSNTHVIDYEKGENDPNTKTCQSILMIAKDVFESGEFGRRVEECKRVWGKFADRFKMYNLNADLMSAREIVAKFKQNFFTLDDSIKFLVIQDVNNKSISFDCKSSQVSSQFVEQLATWSAKSIKMLRVVTISGDEFDSLCEKLNIDIQSFSKLSKVDPQALSMLFNEHTVYQGKFF